MEDAAPPTLLRDGLTWAQMADGHVWRLKGGKHFKAGQVDAVRREAVAAARQLGKPVRTLRDDFGKWHYLWVQFADHRVAVGAPCPGCGSLEIDRLDEHFGRCRSCAALLLFEGGRGERAGDRPKEDLRQYSELVLRRYDEDPSRERYAGYGVRFDGIPCLLLVDYALDADGRRVPDPTRPGQPRYRLRYFPAGPFSDALALDALGVSPDGEDDEDDDEGDTR